MIEKPLEPCKGCNDSVHLSEPEITAMINQVIDSGAELASDSVYEARLAQCNDCSHLQYETTCMLCGCIVQVKGKILSKTCPHPQGSRWVLENI